MELLRRGPMTIDEMSGKLGLTRTAVRAQLSILMGDGVVEQRGARKGPSKPSRMFGITTAAEQQLSGAYVPILRQLLQVLSRRLSAAEFDEMMHEVGRGMEVRQRPEGPLKERVEAAGELLRDLGGLTSVTEDNGRYTIRGHGCPLAAATIEFPQACNVITSLLTEVIGQPVRSCCDQTGRTNCCFEVVEGAA